MVKEIDPKHLAEAAVLVAKADHYLVGINVDEDELDFDTAMDAHGILVEMENKGELSEEVANLAFQVLDDAYGEKL
jgi:hypothetical protein